MSWLVINKFITKVNKPVNEGFKFHSIFSFKRLTFLLN